MEKARRREITRQYRERERVQGVFAVRCAASKDDQTISRVMKAEVAQSRCTATRSFFPVQKISSKRRPRKSNATEFRQVPTGLVWLGVS
jgi:hypothetical protein